jgi:hypothetical protein
VISTRSAHRLLHVKTFGRGVLFAYSLHVVGCHSNTMVLSCLCYSSKLFSLASGEGENLCSVFNRPIDLFRKADGNVACWWKFVCVNRRVQDAKNMHSIFASSNFGLLDKGDIMSGCGYLKARSQNCEK